MIPGAVFGFLIEGGFGRASHIPWPAALWRAGVALLATGARRRWRNGVWLHGLNDPSEQRLNPEAMPSINGQRSLKA